VATATAAGKRSHDRVGGISDSDEVVERSCGAAGADTREMKRRSRQAVHRAIDEDHGHLPSRRGGAGLGEVLEDLLKRSKAALEVHHSGVGDAKEAGLADRVLEEVGDVSGELADWLLVEAPAGGDGEARRAGGLALGDRARGVDVRGFASTVDRTALEVVESLHAAHHLAVLRSRRPGWPLP